MHNPRVGYRGCYLDELHERITADPNPYEAAPLTSDASPATQLSARAQLLPIAITLLVLSILHIIGGLFYFVFVYSQAAAPDAEPMGTHMSIVYCMYYGISMLYCLLLVSGAFSMMRQGSYMWAMTVCILSLIPTLGPCYFLAVPIGIWGFYARVVSPDRRVRHHDDRV